MAKRRWIAGYNCKGISFYTGKGKWVGEIMINGKRTRKAFTTSEDALKFRKQLEVEKYGCKM